MNKQQIKDLSLLGVNMGATSVTGIGNRMVAGVPSGLPGVKVTKNIAFVVPANNPIQSMMSEWQVRKESSRKLVDATINRLLDKLPQTNPISLAIAVGFCFLFGYVFGLFQETIGPWFIAGLGVVCGSAVMVGRNYDRKEIEGLSIQCGNVVDGCYQHSLEQMIHYARELDREKALRSKLEIEIDLYKSKHGEISKSQYRSIDAI